MLQAERNATERLDRLTGHIEALVPEWDLAPAVNALQALRGVALISAVTFMAEIGDVRRFETPVKLMAYMRPMAGARSTAGEYPTVALWPTQVDARCKTGLAPRRTIGHAVSNPRIRACSPTSSDFAPTLGCPDQNKRLGVADCMKKSLKKDIRALFCPHLPAESVSCECASRGYWHGRCQWKSIGSAGWRPLGLWSF